MADTQTSAFGAKGKNKLEVSTETSKIWDNIATQTDTVESGIQTISAAPKMVTKSEDKALFLLDNAKLTKFFFFF